MEMIKLVGKDLAKVKSLALSFIVQLLISLFCLILVTNQFHSGLSTLILLNTVKQNNIIGIRTQNKSNVIELGDEQQLTDGLISILEGYKAYSWYSTHENAYIKIHFFGDFMSRENQRNDEDMILYGKNISRNILETTMREYKINENNVFKEQAYFDSRNGSVDLQNSIVIVSSDAHSISNLTYDENQQILNNLHLYDSDEDHVVQAIGLLDNDKMTIYPHYVNESSPFVQTFMNDLVLFIFFALVFVFVLINLTLILNDIVKTNLREYSISMLYGATNTQIIVRIELLVLFMYLIPALLLTTVIMSVVPDGISPAYFYGALAIGQVIVTVPLIKTLFNSEISSLLRSDFK